MKSIEMLSAIAKGLGPLKDRVVFVGGSTVSLYLTDPAVPAIRPTEDVDCVIEVVTCGEYYKLEAELEKLGFRHAIEAGSPICRWKYRGLTVDIMPTEGSILNFRSNWYPEGYAHSVAVQLPIGGKIRIFSLPYFLASKIEAFTDRGTGDFLTSPDMEDIITVLDGSEDLNRELFSAPVKVRRYLNSEFTEFMKDERFLESLEGNLRSTGRAERIKKILSHLP